jgi:hypothetical protein
MVFFIPWRVVAEESGATRFARRLGRGSKKSISCCSDFIGRLALLAMERKGTAGAFERMILVATIGNW